VFPIPKEKTRPFVMVSGGPGAKGVEQGGDHEKQVRGREAGRILTRGAACHKKGDHNQPALATEPEASHLAKHQNNGSPLKVRLHSYIDNAAAIPAATSYGPASTKAPPESTTVTLERIEEEESANYGDYIG